MSLPDPEKLLECVAEALDTMAFIAVEPLEDNTQAADDLLVTLQFDGALAGELQLTAPRALGALIAQNLLAVGPDAPDAVEKAEDALRELTNITTGLLLRQVCDPDHMPQLAVPVITSAPQNSPHVGAASLSAEGHPVSISFQVRA